MLKILLFYNTVSKEFREDLIDICMFTYTYFTVASPGFFSGGGVPRPLKGYHAPPAGGPGAKAPRTGAKFHFYNDSKYLKMNSFFKNVNIFLLLKSIFSKKNFEKWNIFYQNC